MDTPNATRAPLMLTIDQWKGLLNREGPWLQRCCGNIAITRTVLIESLVRSSLVDAAIIYGACDGAADESALIAVIDRLRTDVTLSRVDALAIVRNAGTHDVIEEAFFPERSDGSPSWATSDASPWPAIVEACRVLVGDFNAVVL